MAAKFTAIGHIHVSECLKKGNFHLANKNVDFYKEQFALKFKRAVFYIKRLNIRYKKITAIPLQARTGP